MKTIITAIDKAQRQGVFTLEEISIVLGELNRLGAIVESHENSLNAGKDSSPEINPQPTSNKKEVTKK